MEVCQIPGKIGKDRNKFLKVWKGFKILGKIG